MGLLRDKYNEEANIYFSNPINIDNFIEKLRSYDDKWAWTIFVFKFNRAVDARTFWDFMYYGEEPSEEFVRNTKVDLIKEFIDKIMLQDNLYLLQYVITGIAPIRYYVQDEYRQMKKDFNDIVNRNCFTNLHLYRL